MEPDFNNIEYNDVFLFKNKTICNMILKNPKTFVYEKFDNNGGIEYKLVHIKKDDKYHYFKLVDKHEVIIYDDSSQQLYKYDLYNFYINNDKNKQLFDTKKIVI